MEMDAMMRARFMQMLMQMQAAEAFKAMMEDGESFVENLYKVFLCGATLGAMMADRDDLATAITEIGTAAPQPDDSIH